MFEIGVVRVVSVNNSAITGRHNRDVCSIFFNMKVYCVFSLELPHRGDSYEYIQYITFNIKKENHPKLFRICSYGIFSKGLKEQLEVDLVNEPSVLEPLKFYCLKV